MASIKDLTFLEGEEVNAPTETVSIETDEFIYIGDKDTDGSFRIQNDSGTYKLAKRIASSWVDQWTVDDATGVTIVGDLTVNGTTTTISTANTLIEDKNIVLNDGGDDASSEGAGITIERTGTDGSFVYEDALGSKWKIGQVGSEIEVVNISSAQTLTNKTIDADNNTISNLEVDNLKAGVLDTDLSTVSASDDTLASAKAIKSYVDSTVGSFTPSSADTLTNKTIDVDNNTVSNIEVDNLKTGVLDTDLSTVSASDDTLASAKAIKAYTDSGTQTFTNKTFDDAPTVKEIATPSNPAAGYQKLYPKSDGNWYQLEDDGTETQLGGGSIPKNNETTSDPTVDNDNTEGYSVFSIWLNNSTTPKRFFMCGDASTGAADWVPISNETNFTDIVQDYLARGSLGSANQQEAGHKFGTSDPETATGDVLAVYHFGDSGSANNIDEKGTYDLTSVGTVTETAGIFGGTKGGFDIATGGLNYYYSTTLWDSAVTNAHTIEMWFKADSASTFWLWGKVFSADVNQDNYKASIGSGDINWYKTVSGSQVAAGSSSTAFPTGSINHVIFTHDSTNGMRVFANGNTTPVATNASTTVPTAGSANNFSLGQLDGDSNTSLNFDGKIYYVRVTDKVVDSAFVEMSYATRYNWNQAYLPSAATITFYEKDAGTGTPVSTPFSTVGVGSDANYLYRRGGIYDLSTDTIKIEAVEN